MGRLSKETKDKVAALYKQGATYDDIVKQTGVARGSIANIVHQYNLPARNGSKHKICICGETIKSGFRFCPYCGRDVRSEKELMIEKLQGLFDLVSLLPQTSCDEAVNTINSAIGYIQKS